LVWKKERKIKTSGVRVIMSRRSLAMLNIVFFVIIYFLHSIEVLNLLEEIGGFSYSFISLTYTYPGAMVLNIVPIMIIIALIVNIVFAIKAEKGT
jgi:hypothetical protein